jgi:hypothetical protein
MELMIYNGLTLWVWVSQDRQIIIQSKDYKIKYYQVWDHIIKVLDIILLNNIIWAFIYIFLILQISSILKYYKIFLIYV